MKYSLGISNFLKEIFSLLLLFFFLFLCIVPLRRLSYLSLLFFVPLHSVGYIVPFLLCLSLLFFSQLFSKQKYSNYCTIVLISHASKVMLNILQARLHQYMNQELPDVQVGFSKGRGTRDQIANIHWIIEQENSRKTSSVSLTWLKPLCGSQQTMENS